MHDTTLQMLFQAVSALAVVGGFIYAALQFRGWRTAQYVANFTTLVELQRQLRKMVVDDPTLAPVGLVLPAEDQEEKMRGYFYNLMQLRVFEIAWFSHQHGQLPEDYFTSWVANMAAITKRPAFRAMWRSDRTKILHEGFRQYMEQVMEDTRILGECYTPTKEHIASTSAASARRVHIGNTTCLSFHPPAAALLPRELVLGHSSAPGWHGTAHIDALQCVPIGWHLGARAHGTVDTGPALRAAAGPQGLPVPRIAGIVGDSGTWHVPCT